MWAKRARLKDLCRQTPQTVQSHETPETDHSPLLFGEEIFSGSLLGPLGTCAPGLLHCRGGSYAPGLCAHIEERKMTLFNQALEELRVRRFADIRKEICCRAVWWWAILESQLRGWNEKS